MKRRLAPASVSLLILLAYGCNRANHPAIPLTSNTTPPILLFSGAGTSRNDVEALETILEERHLEYSTANSEQLNQMSESRLRAYRLLIVPGGNYITMGESLSSGTAARIRDAVQDGLNYLGICAGGLLAGDCKENGLNLTAGVRFDFYSAVNRGIHKAVVPITRIDAPTLDQYWEDGPQFTGWGEIVGKYPDGTPAIVEGRSGDGWVILSGVHPEAPESWRRGMSFTTSTADDNAYAATLIRAALDRTSLPHDSNK
ncbi:BPL-N domain-containing protein [Aquisphaera insulae]|uniref:BPL-N domain-containing protein n=1 Tax=Aquisphaera insulae TaxID=2712864 RepID=UPI0013E9EAAD|nr:BPL-N domain-containing protein [Aquisphaera insulae]